MPTVTEHSEWIQDALKHYEGPLVRYAQRLTGNLELARDVVQDTFLKLCQQDRNDFIDMSPPGENKDSGRLAPWLYTVCRNRAYDVRKKENRMQPMDNNHIDARPDSSRPPDVAAQTHENHALVLEIVATLSEKQQEAFSLKFEHDLTYREIAKVMDMPLSTVSYTITEVMKTLRKRLKPLLDVTSDAQGVQS